MPLLSARNAQDRKFRVIETEWIPLADGARLAARIWLPEGAARTPVPAILEYLPYRRRDGTRRRDDLLFPHLARRGYAGVRVDLRGSGDSDGLLEDEYTARELQDGVEVIHWIARRDWCSGGVGMIGISWGGFNGLQIAALAPAPLKAVVTVCSTDDRYADDIHYKGGCLLNDNMAWSQQMLSYSSRPPDPAVVGERWREMWLARLEHMPLLAANWLRYQRRDGFWKHGSVCENFASIKAAVLIVGGWADAYTDAALRLLDGLSAPRRAIIGPWEHAYPNIAEIGPRIDFPAEVVKWFDRWLKGGAEGEYQGPELAPELTVFIEDAAPPVTHSDTHSTIHTDTPAITRSGHWRTFRKSSSWTAAPEVFHLNADGIGAQPGRQATLAIASPQDVGAAAGSFCPGLRVGGELPGDPRADDAKSLVFESAPLDRDLVLLGAPRLVLQLTADTPQAFIAARLCEVAPGGDATLISWGVRNLTHRESHETPAPLGPGKPFAARVELNSLGRKIPRGHRLRLALSNALWPLVWPAPERGVLRLTTGGSTLALPVCSPEAAVEISEASETSAFDPPPQSAPPADVMRRKPAHRHHAGRTADGALALETFDDFGARHHPAVDLEAGSSVTQRFSIHPDDPLSARADAIWEQTLARGDWAVRTRAEGTMTCDATHFHLAAELRAYEADELMFHRRWDESIERDLV